LAELKFPVEQGPASAGFGKTFSLKK